MNKAKWTPMVSLRTAETGPFVKAMEYRAKRGTDDNKMYLDKTSIRGD
jgi:hypothetical protein